MFFAKVSQQETQQVTATSMIAIVIAAFVWLWAENVAAATASFTALPVDQMAVDFFNSLVNVWIPVISLSALIGLVINMFVGFMRIGARVVGFVFGVSLLAGGLPLLSTLFGGNLVTALILP